MQGEVEIIGGNTNPTIADLNKKANTCVMDGCNNVPKHHGYCHTHWCRMLRTGSPEEKNLTRLYAGLTKKYASEYRVWRQMKDRCYNSKSPGYHHYGGRGIKVCDRWTNKPYGFKNFIEDMGKRPGGVTKNNRPVYTLDRIDVNGDYCPENCRWTTQSIQMHNRRPIQHSTNFTGVSAVNIGSCVKYIANIQKNGIQKRATFNNLNDAVLWRKDKEADWYGI